MVVNISFFYHFTLELYLPERWKPFFPERSKNLQQKLPLSLFPTVCFEIKSEYKTEALNNNSLQKQKEVWGGGGGNLFKEKKKDTIFKTPHPPPSGRGRAAPHIE
jgi:hypothetical protein